MPSAKVIELVKQIEKLSAQERLEIRDAVERLIGEASGPSLFVRELMQEGLLRQPGNPKKRAEIFRNRQPVEIKGEPVSETLIRERR